VAGNTTSATLNQPLGTKKIGFLKKMMGIIFYKKINFIVLYSPHMAL